MMGGACMQSKTAGMQTGACSGVNQPEAIEGAKE
jgi:hypothetical protein